MSHNAKKTNASARSTTSTTSPAVVEGASSSPRMSAETFWDRLPESMQSHWTATFAKPRASNLTQPVSLSLEEKEMMMAVLTRHGRSAEEAIQFYHEKSKDYDPNQTVPYPPRGVTCSTSQSFRNSDLQLVYHADDKPLFGTGSYTFYIARAGSIIDWRPEGIKVSALAFDGRWGTCLLFRVPGGAQIRIHYPDPANPRVELTQDCVFPNDAGKDNPWPVVYTPPRDVSRDVMQL